ncbi:MAG: hypothetical protein IID16_10010 [Candidatus Marinimicrobia bacterium]|nr:hypothetical protein [Candidatus Neomarinimicrobiota bacterium]
MNNPSLAGTRNISTGYSSEKFPACRLPAEIGQAGQTGPPDPDLIGAGDTGTYNTKGKR